MNKNHEFRVVTSFHNPNSIIIHPNDGYDMGLIMHSYEFNVYLNLSEEDFLNRNGEVNFLSLVLENKCKTGTIEIPNKLFIKLGKPVKINLSMKDNSILLKKV